MLSKFLQRSMALKAIVKVSGISNLSDARYCAGMGVEMIGFDIRPESEAYINPLKFQEITGWIAGVKLVGEVHGLSEETIREQLVKYPLDYLEITDLSLVQALANTGIPLIVKLAEDENPELAVAKCAGEPTVAYLLLEIKSPVDPVLIEKLAGLFPLLAGYELSPAEVAKLIANTPVKGFALKGGHEIKPGYKDYDELSDILEALEEED